MGLVMLTGPAEEPVSVEEAKLHLRVSTAADDALIGSLIAAAREHVEARCRRALVTQVWDLYLDAFPAGEEIELAMPPLRAVESVTFFRDDGTSGVMSSLEYVVDAVGEPGAVVLAKGAGWPSAELRPRNGVRVRFEAGYGGAEDVPRAIRQAVLLIVGALYENREQVIVAQGVNLALLPFGIEALLAPFRVMRWLG